jgi:hypothetical protein
VSGITVVSDSMVRNVSWLARPGRSRRRARDAQDDLVLVHSWLRRCLPQQQAEDASVTVLTRVLTPGPDCVAAAPRRTRLQFLAVQEVLRVRGVL